MRQSNYDITRDLMEAEFCKYGQQEMIRKFALDFDDTFLYLHFVGQPYRIHRATGKVECLGGETPRHGDYNESMSIFDYLCYSKPDCRLSGTFCGVHHLQGVLPSAIGGSMTRRYAEYFDRNPQALEQALENLGGQQEGIGDISCKLYPFAQLPILFQFWKSDEDFPASIRILWDKNTLDFIHYETTYYVVGHLLKRLKEQMEHEEVTV